MLSLGGFDLGGFGERGAFSGVHARVSRQGACTRDDRTPVPRPQWPNATFTAADGRLSSSSAVLLARARNDGEERHSICGASKTVVVTAADVNHYASLLCFLVSISSWPKPPCAVSVYDLGGLRDANELIAGMRAAYPSVQLRPLDWSRLPAFARPAALRTDTSSHAAADESAVKGHYAWKPAALAAEVASADAGACVVWVDSEAAPVRSQLLTQIYCSPHPLTTYHLPLTTDRSRLATCHRSQLLTERLCGLATDGGGFASATSSGSIRKLTHPRMLGHFSAHFPGFDANAALEGPSHATPSHATPSHATTTSGSDTSTTSEVSPCDGGLLALVKGSDVASYVMARCPHGGSKPTSHEPQRDEPHARALLSSRLFSPLSLTSPAFTSPAFTSPAFEPHGGQLAGMCRPARVHRATRLESTQPPSGPGGPQSHRS